ncbi:MAG: pilus assembly protein PilP [Nitrospirota bacterium]
MEKRTKVLIIVLVVLGIVSAGFHLYRGYQARKAPKPKMTITMGPARKTVARAKSKPAAVANAPGQQNVEEPVAIKTVETGKEVQYNTPEDFVEHTKLSQSDAESYIQLKLDEANKSLEAARKKKDSVAADRAEKEIALYEKTVALLKTRVLAGPEKNYVYSSLGKRDPFMSPFEVPKVFLPVPRNASPLERVPVDKLMVKAIIWNNKGFRAMIMTPDGRGYTVKTGEPVGDKQGRITRITESSVYVTEKIKDILGDVETNKVVLPLHKEAE